MHHNYTVPHLSEEDIPTFPPPPRSVQPVVAPTLLDSSTTVEIVLAFVPARACYSATMRNCLR
jgi:hypothetical protein